MAETLMSLKNAPELHSFLSTYFPDADPEGDDATTRSFIGASTPELQQRVVTQAKELILLHDLSVEEIGIETNRWFGDSEEAKAWIEKLIELINNNMSGGDEKPKDSNGAALEEGDSVQVIKDLKVKGGTSDLKRGTLIKKIHLIGDSENIECRVDGSTLVLKTCFLKKA